APLTVAARARIVSAAGIRLDHLKSVRPFKGIFCHDISEFESSHPSHAVGLSASLLVGVGEHSGDGAWRWSFLDSAIGTAGPPPCPSMRSPGRSQGEPPCNLHARLPRPTGREATSLWPCSGRDNFGRPALAGLGH